jgi:prepilin-type N-terminal cleavage/methylation domain-containing protein
MYFKNNKIKKIELIGGRAKGFTLLEVIVTLVVAAILGTILVAFMNSNLVRSADPVVNVGRAYNLEKVMENITADYKNNIATGATPLATMKSNIGTAGGGTITNAYGSYKVIYNDYITFTCDGSNNCTASSGGSSILKVTIADPLNIQKITALFTQ